MKIKALIEQGTIKVGDIIDAAVNPGLNTAIAFDSTGSNWWFYHPQFEVIRKPDTIEGGSSLVGSIGAVPKTVHIEF